jgi:chromate transporter
LKSPQTKFSSVLDLALLFLRLGFTAFGGPAAHIAMFHNEVVTRRKWLDDQEFLDLLGATNLIPGPNSTEMTIHIGLVRMGWIGFLVAGTCFILPAMGIVLFLSWLYVRYGSTPEIGWLLAGVKPVVIAVIAEALWSLGRKAIKGKLTALTGLIALGMYALNVHPLAILALGGAMVMLLKNYPRLKKLGATILFLPAGGMGITALASVPFSLSVLFLTFLKIGAVLYGSGYVLLAFLHADFVSRLGWLTEKQLLDAIAIGQVTPGPVFTSATFIGYLLGGVPGAVLGTLGIFLPSFVFVALSSRAIPRLRSSVWLASLLDGVNVSSLGLMAGVTFQLSVSSFQGLASILIFLLSGILLVRYRVNTTWLILAGALVGLFLKIR